MATLTNSQINNACFIVNHRIEAYSNLMSSMFKIMFNFGVREGEVMQLERWSLNIDTTYSLQTEKGGGIRTFNNTDLDTIYKHAIASPPSSGFLYSTRQLRDCFNKFSPYHEIFTLRKRISCHLFRHNFIKQKVQDGFTYDELRALLAVSDSYVPEYYNTSIIYTP